MAGYDISKIDMNSKGPTVPQILTGNIVVPALPNAPKNAELEGGEYAKQPGAPVQEVVGAKHTQGGVDVNIQGGTQIISDTLKLRKSDVKNFKDNFGLDLSVKDTFATAIDKYTKKIGLDKLNHEQEELFIELGKTLEKNASEGTQRVNQDYLSSKIHEIEKQKISKEAERDNFFNHVFSLQEQIQKPNQPTQQFKYGGVSEESFNKICQEFGMTPEQGKAMFGENGMPKYALGGTFEEIKNNIAKGITNEAAAYDELNAKRQDGSITDEQYKELTNAVANSGVKASTSAVNSTNITPEVKKIIDTKWNGDVAAYNQFQKTKGQIEGNAQYQEDLFKQYQADIKNPKNYTSGTTKGYLPALENRTKAEVVQALIDQEERNARLAAFKLDAAKTSQAVSSGNINKEAKALIDKTPGLQDLNFQKGHVSQAAYIANANLMNTDKYKGYSVNQTGVGDEPLGTISGIDNANTNTTLGQRLVVDFTPKTPPVAPAPKVQPIPSQPRVEGAIVDNVVVPVNKKYPRMFFHPDQSIMPPTPLAPTYMGKIDTQYIDPLRIGIENNIQELANQRQSVTRELDALPPAQRAAALAQLAASSQQGANTAFTQANQINAQNQAVAEQFNIGQFDRNQQNNFNVKQMYNNKMEQSQANLENDLRNYFAYNNRVSINNLQNDNKLNLLGSLFDYTPNFYGNQIQFDPNTNYTVQQRASLANNLFQ